MTCSYCGTELFDGAMFCGECGRSVVSRGARPLPVAPIDPDRQCAQCGTSLATSEVFCPECGFVTATVQPGATIVEPVSPGKSSEAPATESTSAEAVPFEDRADIEQTRIVTRGVQAERFVLQFSTGESVSVTGTGLIGRNPHAEPGEYFDTSIAIRDPGKSVSKTHLEFGQDGGMFWISDRFSGNGTLVREPDHLHKRCDAGKRYRIARGSRVEMGEQFFVVS